MKRRIFVTAAVLGCAVALAVLVGLRRSQAPIKLRASVPEVALESTDVDAGVAATDEAVDGGAAAALDAIPAAPPPAPVKLVALGWELGAPGLMSGSVPNQADPVQPGVALQVRVAATLPEVEDALANGGGAATGADVAIVPLTALVAGHERLRALSLYPFMVLGFSHGRDAIYGSARFEALRGGDVRLVGEVTDPATMLALYLLEDLAGRRVTLVARSDARAADAELAAVDRSDAQRSRDDARNRTLWLSSADAARFMPYVVVAPEAFLRADAARAVQVFRALRAGVEAIRADVPAAARTIAGHPGAPSASDVLARLGHVEYASVESNARLFGLSGRSPLTLMALFDRQFAILRRRGVIVVPAPELAPVYSGAIEVVARELRASPAVRPGPAEDQTGPALLRVAFPPRSRPDEVVAKVAFLAELFSRSALRVQVRGNTDETRLQLEQRFGIAAARVRISAAASPGRAEVEVLRAR